VALAGLSSPRLNFAETLRIADRCVSAGAGIPSPPQPEKRGFDCVCDFAGTAASLAFALAAVRPGGRVLLYGVHECPVPQFDANQIVLKDLTIYGSLSDREGWDEVIALVASRKLRLAPLITHRFPLESAPEAYDFVRQKKDGVVKAVLLL
jgi:L-iditol 2-dehydrogenase